MKRIFSRGDIAVLSFTLFIAVVAIFWYCFPRRIGRKVLVTSPMGETRYSLSQPSEFSVSGADGLTLTIQIENGRARVAHSDCPDRLCVHSGWLSQSGQAAVCVPAAVSVRIVGGEAAVDGVTA
ncbi:MAG: NusG domain II-containing protein [Clostridia bacterium]|nr:NusG domain II-containing protein [Clostridia bacterium]